MIRLIVQFLVLQCTGLILPGKMEVTSDSLKAAEKGGNFLVFMYDLLTINFLYCTDTVVEVYLLPLDDAMKKSDAVIKIEAVKKGNNPMFKQQVHQM